MWSAGKKIELKSPREIDLMRSAGELVGRILDEISTIAKPGATTRQMDTLARERISAAGAEALFLGVENPQARFPFPAAICASVNEEIVHGVPDDRPLADGDIVSIDCGVRLKGYCGDSARTFAIGAISSEAQRLLDVTRAALEIAVEEIRAYARWSSVARKMQACVEDAGFGVVKDFVGHGIGREMHEEPKVPNYVDRDRRNDFDLVPGMVIAVEPMVAAGDASFMYRDDDRWSVITRDRSLAAHFEHTLAVTDSGAEVLTPVGRWSPA
jgi:methionyl aminopeptidase